MTLVFGYALDPESGIPLAGREVTATLQPAGASVPPIDGGSDKFITGVDGRWQLSLPPTAGTGAYYRVREWLNRTYYIDVPNSSHVENVTDLVIDPGTGRPPPANDPLYVTRAELAAPSGVATLGPDGKLAVAQRPAGSSGGLADQVLVTGVAGATLSGHIIVHPRMSDQMLVPATADNLAHLAVPLWMTTGAVLSGDTVTALAFGEFTEPTWAWTPGPIYLGLYGEITQTPPAAPVSAFLVQLGYATSPISVFFDRSPSIQLI